MVSAITSSINDLASGSTSTAGSQEVSSDQFLTLLIAQLQNQDPMNPIENQDFVAELATFSSLEQQQMQTGLLEQLIQGQSNSTSTQALSLIGKEVSVAENQFTLQADKSIEFSFLADESGIENVKIFNSSGDIVRSDLVTVYESGEVSYHFDGKNNNGDPLPPGEYRMSVGDTIDEEGNVTEYPVFIRGFVEGVNYVDGTPILIVDGNATPFGNIFGVYERTDTQ